MKNKDALYILESIKNGKIKSIDRLIKAIKNNSLEKNYSLRFITNEKGDFCAKKFSNQYKIIKNNNIITAYWGKKAANVNIGIYKTIDQAKKACEKHLKEIV
jgi:hypothetical protein